MNEVPLMETGTNTSVINTKCSTPKDLNTTTGNNQAVCELLNAFKRDIESRKQDNPTCAASDVGSSGTQSDSLFTINKMSLPEAAMAYERMGFSIIPLLPKTKRAIIKGWSSPDFKRDSKYWSSPDLMDWNIGLSLGRNHILSVDIDSENEFYKVMEEIRDELVKATGVEKPFWECRTAGIKSGKAGKGKLIFKQPEGDYPFLNEKYELNWGTQEDGIHIFELRGGIKFQDVAPPSIHPDTLTTYQWVNSETIEMAPPDMVYLWEHWTEYFHERLLRLDPNFDESVLKSIVAQKSPQNPPKPSTNEKKKVGTSTSRTQYNGIDVIKKYNESHSIEEILQEHGYINENGRGSNRMIRPNSTSHSAGIVLDFAQNKCKSYHSDSLSDGWKHDPFDVLTLLDYNGDTKAAYKAALRELGLDTASQILKKLGKISKQVV